MEAGPASVDERSSKELGEESLALLKTSRRAQVAENGVR